MAKKKNKKHKTKTNQKKKKNTPPLQRYEEERVKCQEVHSWHSQIPYPWWATHKLENNYTTEVLQQEWELWAPHSAPQPRDLAWGGAPRAFGFEGQQGSTAGAPQDWGGETLYSSRSHTRACTHWVPAQKQWIYTGAWAIPTCWSWSLLGRGGKLWLFLAS